MIDPGLVPLDGLLYLADTSGPGLHLADTSGPDTDGLADFLRGFFGPLFLVIVSIVAIFFLFTREITKFAQFLILAILIGLIFYVPGIVEVIAVALARAMGVSTE
ncbi:MAG TPA: hypothetical protein K8V84_16470 [Nocardiopsis listeri]|uniref:hypothetical protein n=1 Tax=Nocardiopsis listeri TaxID=53440 RepID=UPI001DE205C3|nr:hypothetical protein [Nocardiopsis listeri]HJE60079.1 hypothetical protein [Nocardiopsis listeri]